MGALIFDKDAVLELIEHAQSAPRHVKPSGEPDDHATLRLVGDQGVYLMSNGEPPMPSRRGGGGLHVVYALGCDPDRDDDFYKNKRRLFGGDGGFEEISIDEVLSLFSRLPDADSLVIAMTQTSFILMGSSYHVKPDVP